MNNLAATYWNTKQLDKSIPLFVEVLKGQEAKLGRDHPDTLMTVANLGVNYKDAGRYQEAIPLLEEAHRAARKYPTLSPVGNNLLDTYLKASETAKFRASVTEQLAEARQTFRKDSPQLAQQLFSASPGVTPVGLAEDPLAAEDGCFPGVCIREGQDAPHVFVFRECGRSDHA